MWRDLYRKTLLIILVYLFLGFSIISTGNKDKNDFDFTCITNKILYVGGNGSNNYTNIQDAIDDAMDGYTVFVYNGTYYENIIIDKPIKLIGENKYTTIIDGSKNLHNLGKKFTIIVKVIADDVAISRFTIQNAIGIDGRGIYVLKNGGLSYTEDNLIVDNIIKNCSYGLLVVNPINNTIANISYYNCSGGIYITKIPYYENYLYNNTANGKPLLFYVNKKNLIIDGKGAGGIGLLDCKNCVIYNLSVTSVTVGMDISYSSDIIVINSNICKTNRGGIYVHHSSFCRFIGNTFKDDNWGIFFRKSNHNEIWYNNFINITMPDWFDTSFYNNWNKNYWEKPRLFPKLIFGKIGFTGKIPWFNIDWHPLQKPYTTY